MKDVLKQALRDLENAEIATNSTYESTMLIRETLAQPPLPVQEPVAHVYLFDHDGKPRVAWDNAKGIKIGDRLYATSPAPLPAQEPVAWGVFEGNLHDMFFTQGEAQEMADLKGTHAEVRPFYTTPPAAQPAQEAIYGMNQDDWKDVVAAIAKVRDGRGIYLACRPADVFQDWFLALGTAKVKEKNT
jgi:hypothetical protein